ncbi:MAG: GntR family transcriptional regulator [Nitrososphaerales archaeon]
MDRSFVEPLERETLAEQAVRSLKRHILAERLRAGTRLPSERELSESLGVSRNVVREALRALVAEGYVSKEAGRGAFVRPYDPTRLEADLDESVPDYDQGRDLREVRVALEVGALSFVVRRINTDDLVRLRALTGQMDDEFAAGRPLRALDIDFHETLMTATRNPGFLVLRRSLLSSVRLVSLDDSSEFYSRSRDDNTRRTCDQIVTALERRDLEAAEGAMRAHLIFDLPPTQARLFLFVDDDDIAEMRGLVRTLHPANKHHANPVLSPAHPWEGQRIYPSNTFVYDQVRKEYCLWYHGYRYLSSMEEQCSLCYAVSIDGVHWRRPCLGIVPFEGDNQTNLLVPWGDPNRPDTMSSTIIRDPEPDDPSRRYIMLHYCSGMHPVGLGLSYSPDGLHWEPHPDNPVDAGGPVPIGDVVCALVEPRGRRAAVYYRVRLRVRPRGTLARAESQDLRHWSGHSVIFESYSGDGAGAELNGITPFRYGDMQLAFLSVSVSSERRGELQLASSRDGIHWQRADGGQSFLSPGPEGSFDAHTVWRPTAPVVIGDSLHFYYAGDDGLTRPASGETRGGIGLATLTMDRFVSLRAQRDEGQVTTKPVIIADQTRLLMNAVTNPDGYVSVEILDSRGAPIQGFTDREALPFRGMAVFHPVCWTSHADLSALTGERVQIRFTLRDAHLFAFRLTRPDAADADLVAGIC